MRITVIAVGTRGDVQPLLALAAGLRAAGHTVRFATEASYAAQVAGLDCEFHRLSGDSETFFSGRGGVVLRDSANRGLKEYTRFARSYMTAYVRKYLRECVPPCQDAEAVICLPHFAMAPSLGERFGIPGIIAAAHPVPELPTRAFACPALAEAQSGDNEQLVARSWRRGLGMLRVGQPLLQQWRQETLGLPVQTLRQALEQTSAAPHLFGFSPLVVPKPAEWGDEVEITGYWFLEGATSYQPPVELREFLDHGEPPVVVGFGSHVNSTPEQTTQLVLEALDRAGRRGILISGFGGLKTRELPPSVFSAASIPYDWLLPRSLALVHHGGSGATAIALRMGTPQVITPFGWDQTFWGHRAANLGTGVGPISPQAMTAAVLAAAITRVTTDGAIRQRAADVGELIRREQGVENAVAAVERFALQRRRTYAFAADPRG